jgi:hypothetical protein
MVTKPNQRTLTEKGNMDKEELVVIKKKEKVFDHFWTLEEQQTILGLLKGRKMKKKLKDKKIKNV